MALNSVLFTVFVGGTFAGLTTPATAAHIHGPAAPGQNAAVILPLTATAGTSGTITGTGTLSSANATNLLNGLTYVNVHTSTFPGGEIRGQIYARVPGDLNCDNHVDFGDINAFVVALSDPAGYQTAFPACNYLNGDVNDDGEVDFGDINPFVALLTS